MKSSPLPFPRLNYIQDTLKEKGQGMTKGVDRYSASAQEQILVKPSIFCSLTRVDSFLLMSQSPRIVSVTLFSLGMCTFPFLTLGFCTGNQSGGETGLGPSFKRPIENDPRFCQMMSRICSIHTRVRVQKRR